MFSGILQSQHTVPGTPRCTMLLKSLICIGVAKLGLLSFLVSRANAPFPLCLVRLVTLKLSLKLASTGYLHSTSIPILVIYSSVSFVGEGCLLAGLPCFSLSSLDSLQLTRSALPPYYPPSYVQSIHSPHLITIHTPMFSQFTRFTSLLSTLLRSVDSLASPHYYLSWYDLPSFLSCLCLSPAPSLSPSDPIQPCLPAFCCLCSNSEVYLCNYAMSALGLASD